MLQRKRERNPRASSSAEGDAIDQLEPISTIQA